MNTQFMSGNRLIGIICFVLGSFAIVDKGVAQITKVNQQLLQQLLDEEALQPYLNKPELKYDSALVIRNNGIPANFPKLTKFGYPVLVLTAEELFFRNIQGYLEFKRADFKEGSAVFEFNLISTLVSCKFEYYFEDGSWKLLKKQIAIK